ncbi:hypothetical protein SUDANB23_06676 (plasmid) [Streptomyces sp. enrichment culture]
MFPTPSSTNACPDRVEGALATGKDDPFTWLLSGQALQRLLLQAAGHGVMAAFHTHPLEVLTCAPVSGGLSPPGSSRR